MREYKFRTWDKNKKVMSYFEFTRIEYSLGRAVAITYTEDYLDNALEEDNLEDFIIMQSVGLKDKNGKEIYEGDVCLYYNSKPIGEYYGEDSTEWEDIEFTGAVEYGRLHACFTVGGTRWWDPVEVIGNVYENPTLLDQEESK